MSGKRFYDAARDSYQFGSSLEHVRVKRRLSIPYLCSESRKCIICDDDILPDCRNPVRCSHCLSVICSTCMNHYADATVNNRDLRPMRCAKVGCRVPFPLTALRDVLPSNLFFSAVEGGTSPFRGEGESRSNDNGSREETNSGSNISTTSALPTSVRSLLSSSSSPPADISDRNNSSKGPSEDCEEEMTNLIRAQGWQRCPQCGVCVERLSGCRHMVCRCGCEFCYDCGTRWVRGRYTCPGHCWNNSITRRHALDPDRFAELRGEFFRRLTTLLENFGEDLRQLHQGRLTRLARRVPVRNDCGTVTNAPQSSIDFVLNAPSMDSDSSGRHFNPEN